MLAFVNDRAEDYKIENFVMELCEASKYLGALEAKITSYHFEKNSHSVIAKERSYFLYANRRHPNNHE